MRKITSTLVLALIAVAAIAGHTDASNLVLTTYNHGSFTVQLDGQEYQGYDQLELENLSPGKYYLRVDRKRQSQHGYGGSGSILYKGYIDIPAGSEVRAHIDNRRKLQVEVNPIYADCQTGCYFNACTCDNLSNGYPTPYGNGTWTGDACNGNYYGNTSPYGYNTWGYGQSSCGSGYGYYGQYHNYGQSAGYGQYSSNWTPVMTHQGFTDFRRSLQDMSFEAAKLNVIQSQLNHVRFTAAQTRTMMSLFNFDSSRLELAKMIYPTVVNPGNYFIVADAFTFDSTRQELYQFMQI